MSRHEYYALMFELDQQFREIKRDHVKFFEWVDRDYEDEQIQRLENLADEARRYAISADNLAAVLDRLKFPKKKRGIKKMEDSYVSFPSEEQQLKMTFDFLERHVTYMREVESFVSKFIEKHELALIALLATQEKLLGLDDPDQILKVKGHPGGPTQEQKNICELFAKSEQISRRLLGISDRQRRIESKLKFIMNELSRLKQWQQPTKKP